jgi:aminopeptidase N
LPKLAEPLRYELALDVDPSAATFHGTVRIDVNLPAATSFVVLHANGLTVAHAHALIDAEPTSTRPAHPSQRAASGATTKEELVLAFDQPLPAGHASLVLTFDAPYGENLAGVYRVNEASRWYGFTQFEATDARRAFPCFDEPTWKTPFDVSLTVPTGMLAVANAPETSRIAAGAKTTYRFAPTQPLPTYLVAFAFGDLETRELARTGGPPIRLVTTRGKADLGALALETTSALVDALATWFAIPYPYAKLDLVAVPEFAAGAMENAGLITFRDELLLVDEKRSSLSTRRHQALVIAHELAHQWFGNLVTAAWWDDLWLTEGFATWMEARIVDLVRPEYHAGLAATVSQLNVMDLDSLTSARAVRQAVVTTGQATEAFDEITYEKGAAVLATIEGWVGRDAFKRGIHTYLTTHAFQSVHTDRLFSALDQASGKNVSELASTFLDHPGVPEVTANLECEPASRWHLELGQERWRRVGTAGGGPDDTQPEHAWNVPVCVHAEGEATPLCTDLFYGAPSLVAARRCPKWVHPNASDAYYRFSMPEASMVRLAEAHKALSVAERLSALSNAWAAVRAGKLKPNALLKILAAFDDDPSPEVVESVVAILRGLDASLVEPNVRSEFRALVGRRLAPRKRSLAWKNTAKTDDTQLREAVLGAMGTLAEDDTTLREAEAYAAEWVRDPSAVDADIAEIAVPLASHKAPQGRVDELMRVVRDGKTREARILALHALGSFDDPALLERALDALLSDTIRTSDIRYVLRAAQGRRKSEKATDAWIRAHWDAIHKRLGGALGEVLLHSLGTACTQVELDERTAFYSPRAASIEGGARPLASAIEASTNCILLRAYGARALTKALTSP